MAIESGNRTWHVSSWRKIADAAWVMVGMWQCGLGLMIDDRSWLMVGFDNSRQHQRHLSKMIDSLQVWRDWWRTGSGVRRGGPRGPWPPPMAAPIMGEGQERNVRNEASGQVLSLWGRPISACLYQSPLPRVFTFKYFGVYFRADDVLQPAIVECNVFKGKFYCACNTLFSAC